MGSSPPMGACLVYFVETLIIKGKKYHLWNFFTWELVNIKKIDIINSINGDVWFNNLPITNK